MAERVHTSGDFSYVLLREREAMIVAWRGKAGNLVIPDRLHLNRVVSIGNKAFQGCAGLTGVSVPEGVTHIGEKAFQGCTGLTCVILPESVVYLGSMVFQGCGRLTGITLPAGVTSIGVAAFYGCVSLACINLPDRLTGIAESAFYGCISLAGVRLPDSVAYVGEKAFCGCSSLADVLLPPGGALIIEPNAFDNCSGLILTAPPGSQAEKICRDNRLTWRNPGSSTVYSREYRFCLLPDGTAEIQAYTGNGTEVRVPGVLAGRRVSRIGDEAFSGPDTLTAVTIPDSVTSVGDNPFAGKNLTGITVSPDHPSLAVIGGVLFSKPDKRLVCCPRGQAAGTYRIPQGIVTIGACAFLGCDSLNRVIIPDSVTAIGDRAFDGCTLLTDLSLPAGVQSIGRDAFTGCPYITLVVHRGSCAEAYCQRAGLRYHLACVRVCGDYQYIVLEDGTAEILKYLGDEESLRVPDTLDGRTVSRIGDEAFADCYSLQTIILPERVAAIGDKAFMDCTSLTDVTLPAGLKEISEGMFAGCFGLDGITLPAGLMCIRKQAFLSCLFLEQVTVPEHVAIIGEEAFAYCAGLIGAVIPPGVSHIGARAFYECGRLTLTVPRDSYARTYCLENGLPFTYPDSQDWLNT